MTTPQSEPHNTAVIAKLKAELPVKIGVGYGVGPAVPPPYVTVYPDPGEVSDTYLCGDRSRLVMHWMMSVVGEGPEQAAWAADKVRAVMLGTPPVVAGRRISRLEQTLGSQPIRRDESVQPPVYISTLEFRALSQPG